MRGRTAKACLVVAVVAFVAASYAITRDQEPETHPGPRNVHSVVVVGVPGLGLDDLTPSQMPVLSRMAEQGAIAAANVRTRADLPDVEAAYGSLGAGNRVGDGETPVAAYGPEEPVPTEDGGSASAADLFEARTGTVSTSELLLPDVVELTAERAPPGGAGFGAMTDAVRGAGGQVAVVSNADTPALSGDLGRSTPAAIAASGSDGQIDLGSVSAELLRPDDRAPFGVRVDAGRFVSEVVAAVEEAEVVLVDPGEMTRASRSGLDGETQETYRVDALRLTDWVLGRMVEQIPTGTLVVVVGVTPPGESWALTPVVIHGSGVPRGFLHSGSTHRLGLVTLTDLAPSILEVLRIDPDPAMIGTPLRYRPGTASFDGMRALNDLSESRDRADLSMTGTFVAVQAVLYAIMIGVLLRRRATGAAATALEIAALACSAWPLATFLLRADPDLSGQPYGTLAFSWLLAFVVAVAASRLRRHPLDPLLAITGSTVALIVLDLATGAHLQFGSFFGYAPHRYARYTGLGNPAFALMAGSTIALVVAIVSRSRDRVLVCWVSGAICTVVVLADGAPWMGADVGGTLSLIPVLGLTIWSLAGRRLHWRALLTVIGFTAVVVVAYVVYEATRAPVDRTHVGRFFLSSGDGSNVWSTIDRKWAANTAALRSSIWAWFIPIGAALALYLLVVRDAWRGLLPKGSPERVGVIATISMGGLGWLVNDSGVVVLALTCVYLGPLVVLLALRRWDLVSRTPDRPTAAGSVVASMDEVVDAVVADRSGEGPRTGSHDQVVVAIVPAMNRADTVRATVDALLAQPSIDRVLVVDDASQDRTAEEARRAGADVLQLATNRGKGGAVAAAVAATPEADVYVLIDADLAATAAAAHLLLEPVLVDEADLVVGVLPSAGSKGGFGTVRSFAAWGIERASGAEVRAPLSGQRAMRADLLRDLHDADRFGLEVAMTIDAVRRGARFLEVEVPMDHRHTGRSISGFSHRARQGVDIARSLWPRLTSPGRRMAGVVGATIVLMGAVILVGGHQAPPSVPLADPPSRVLVFGMTPFGFDDLDRGETPNLDRLINEGAIGAMTVRSHLRHPQVTEGYLALGAGARVRSAAMIGETVRRDTDLGSGTAAEHVELLSGRRPTGDLIVLGGPGAMLVNDNAETASAPGTLGESLTQAGLSASAVGNSDRPETVSSIGVRSRPTGAAVMGSDSSVTHGSVSADDLLTVDPTAPFGVRSNPDALVEATVAELARSEVVVVDPGDLTRADLLGSGVAEEARRSHLSRALTDTDRLLGRLLAEVDDRTLVLVVSVAPRDAAFRLTPVAAWGPGVTPGTLTSSSTQRSGLVTITDVAPTILAALQVDPVNALPGNPFRYEPGAVDLGALRQLDTDTVVREVTYVTQSRVFIQAHLVIFGLAVLLLLARPARAPASRPWIEWLALGLASYPAATFLVRLVPSITNLFTYAQVTAAVLLAATIGHLASRARRHPLAPLSWVFGLTIAVVVIDTWIGTPMHLSSWLGYSLHSAGRFYGVPNTTFAVLGSVTLLWAGIVVAHARRRREALVKVAMVFLVVLLSAGLPMLGADVGSLITLFPVFVLLWMALSGRRFQLRMLFLAGTAMVLLVVLAAGIDLARAEESRSHLGQFAQRMLDEGPSTLVETFMRKQSANFRILQSSVWTQLVPMVAAFSFYLLVWQRRARELLPPGGPLRQAAVAVVGAAVLGFASNDSGPLVISLFLSFLPVLLLFRALMPPDEDPVLLPAEVDLPT